MARSQYEHTTLKTTQDSKKQMASLHNEAKDALSQAYEEMDTRGHQHTYLYRPQEEVTSEAQAFPTTYSKYIPTIFATRNAGIGYAILMFICAER